MRAPLKYDDTTWAQEISSCPLGAVCPCSSGRIPWRLRLCPAAQLLTIYLEKRVSTKTFQTWFEYIHTFWLIFCHDVPKILSFSHACHVYNLTRNTDLVGCAIEEHAFVHFYNSRSSHEYADVCKQGLLFKISSQAWAVTPFVTSTYHSRIDDTEAGHPCTSSKSEPVPYIISFS